MSEKPEALRLNSEELKSLQSRIASRDLTEEDLDLFSGLLSFNLWLQEQLDLAKLSIARLKQMFGFKREKKRKK